MKILMCTNTYAPHVGGVARSVERFTRQFRRDGHEVWVVAPAYEEAPTEDRGVLRFPAMQHFNGSDFSVPVPVPGRLASLLENFHPDVVHSHHPFLLGDLALRVAASRNLPIVFTHHTRYELYTHYVPGKSSVLKRFVIELTSGYCNLCDAVIAPSESIRELLLRRDVTVPIEVIPTGLDPLAYTKVSKDQARAELGIPADAFVVGHVGRLAPEKNLDFLTRVVRGFLASNRSVRFLVAGVGPAKDGMLAQLRADGLEDRVHAFGVLDTETLARVYRAMDVFAFASRTETQGMVLTEAMAAGVPVVALDAPGVRDVVADGVNGRLLQDEEPTAFVEALVRFAGLDPERRDELSRNAGSTALQFSMPAMARRVRDLYERLSEGVVADKDPEQSAWNRARRRLREEWRIVRNIAQATTDAVLERSPDEGA
jgi:glycosyltransferase involved in cell wall biosynthesis